MDLFAPLEWQAGAAWWGCAVLLTAQCLVAESTEQIGLKQKGIKKKKKKANSISHLKLSWGLQLEFLGPDPSEHLSTCFTLNTICFSIAVICLTIRDLQETWA